MYMFKIDTTDLSKYVLADGSYNVQREQVYEVWEDAQKKEHREITRPGGRVVGSFDVFFPTLKEYNDFLDLIALKRLSNLTLLLTVAPNNEKTTATFYGFIDFAPARKRDGMWNDVMNKFTINVREA